MRVNGMRSVFSLSAVCGAVDQFVGHGGGLLERQNRIAKFIEKLAHCL